MPTEGEKYVTHDFLQTRLHEFSRGILEKHSSQDEQIKDLYKKVSNVNDNMTTLLLAQERMLAHSEATKTAVEDIKGGVKDIADEMKGDRAKNEERDRDNRLERRKINDRVSYIYAFAAGVSALFGLVVLAYQTFKAKLGI